jgi:arabinose-5-phosphate isomerase
MHQGDELPQIGPQCKLSEAILEISKKRLGMVAVLDADAHLLGVITDGDLRRLFERGVDPHKTLVSQVMSKSPATISEAALAVEAAQLMEARDINKLPVLDATGRCVGALQVNDLLIAKVI